MFLPEYVNYLQKFFSNEWNEYHYAGRPLPTILMTVAAELFVEQDLCNAVGQEFIDETRKQIKSLRIYGVLDWYR